MQKLLADHMSYVSEKIQTYVQQKIAMEVPTQIQNYEERLKREIEQVIRSRTNTLYKSMNSHFNIKLKFLLNRLGHDTSQLELTPFLEQEEFHIDNVGFTQEPPMRVIEQKEMQALQNDV